MPRHDWLTERNACAFRGVPVGTEYDRALAQAGDVLEREMEAMMRKIAVSER